VIREISPALAIISLIPSLICGQPGYGGVIVRDRDSVPDSQVQRQKTSWTGDRENECGGGWFIYSSIFLDR
jgi:cytochrome c oxidase assembly protein Cox11